MRVARQHLHGCPLSGIHGELVFMSSVCTFFSQESPGKTGRRRDGSSIEENIKDARSCRVSGILRNAGEGEEEGSGKVMGGGGATSG